MRIRKLIPTAIVPGEWKWEGMCQELCDVLTCTCSYCSHTITPQNSGIILDVQAKIKFMKVKWLVEGHPIHKWPGLNLNLGVLNELMLIFFYPARYMETVGSDNNVWELASIISQYSVLFISSWSIFSDIIVTAWKGYSKMEGRNANQAVTWYRSLKGFRTAYSL
jgi:hypothetical protein